jgi:hypothetical protein
LEIDSGNVIIVAINEKPKLIDSKIGESNRKEKTSFFSQKAYRAVSVVSLKDV